MAVPNKPDRFIFYDGIWIILVSLTILLVVAGNFPHLIETYYSNGFYPAWSQFWRLSLGWIPFSIGDLVYLFLIIWVTWHIITIIGILVKKDWQRLKIITRLRKLAFILLVGTCFFYLSWGLNYSRLGIASQLELEVAPYSVQELDTLGQILQSRLNDLAKKVDVNEREKLEAKNYLFHQGYEAYQHAVDDFPFLKFRFSSTKPSLFSYPGNLLGFWGYYNPFTSEGQVNTTIPVFARPFTTTHEMAHQLGYAKESEANFVSFLAAKSHTYVPYRYSVYFEMYRYTVNEIYKRDSLLASGYREKLHPQVLADLKELRNFHLKYESVAEDYFMWIFNQFLKANKQPAGTESYNHVVAWLVAYRKKYGNEAI